MVVGIMPPMFVTASAAAVTSGPADCDPVREDILP